MAERPISRWLGIALLCVIATVFGANHVAARFALDHGASVTTAVAVRSAGTVLFVLALLLAARVPLVLPPATRGRALAVGIFIAVQGYCIYSSVARIPVALALLAFNAYPVLLMLLTWAAGGERPSPRAAVAMAVALFGLSLALDVWGQAGSMAGRWQEIGTGVLWGFGAAVTFSIALLLTTRWLKEVDGRLRTLYMMITTTVLVTVAAAAAGDFALPRDATGWTGLALLTVCYGIAITSLFVVLPRVGVSNAVALNFEPIAVLGLAWVALGQAVTPLQIVGAFIVVGAIMTLGRK